MSRFTLLAAFFLFSLSAANAQNATGNLAGKITDASFNKPLPGAVITIIETNKKFIAESDGAYRFTGIPAGRYSLQVEFVGYDIKKISEVDIIKGQATALDITLEPSKSSNLQGVVVSSVSAKKENLNTLLVTRRNAAVVSDGISADMIRKSPDRNTSDVLRRVSGTTVQENKFVVVRGMNDRYNEAMLNGTLLPSSEPDRKTFAFDIFPSEVVDNITIYKSASPDLPGSFTGGLIQINTKDVPDKNFISFKTGVGYNSIASKQDFYYNSRSKTDWLGYDKTMRPLPEAIANTTNGEFNDLYNAERKTMLDRSFANTWGLSKRSASPFNNSLQLTGGFNTKLGKANYPKLGGIFGITYNSSNTNNSQTLKSYLDAGDETNYDYADTVYAQNILASALGNVVLRLDANNKIYINNILSGTSTNQSVVRTGSTNALGRNFVNAQSYFFASNRIYNTQVGGEHYFPKSKLKVKWLGYYTDLKREEPDYRFLVYQKYDVSDPYTAVLAYGPLSTTESGLRFFGSVKDYSKGANTDVSLPFELFKNPQTLKAGAGYFYDERFRTIRYFNTVSNTTGEAFAAAQLPADQIFASANFEPNTGFYYNEPDIPQNNYDGSVKNTTAYAMLDNRIGKKIRLVWGIRLESFRNLLHTLSDNRTPITVDIKKNDWLPSANLIYSVLPKANLRFSYSKTVGRPLFRELAPQLFYDFLYSITYSGNTSLVLSYIDNYEVRWEHYFKNAQYYSASIFHKKFKDPIEQSIANASAESLFVNFTNTPGGETSGIELEARKDFGFLGKTFENLVAYTNVSFIKSVVSVTALTGTKLPERPLFGQSPWIVNASLQYSDPKSNFAASVLFNQAGSRLFLIGGRPIDFIWEKPRPMLDFKVSKSFLKNGIVEFSFGDILHKNAVYFNDENGNKKFDGTETDRVVISRKFGYTMSLAVGYRF